MKINPQSFLDVLLLEIRRVTITYSAKKKRDRQENELLLIHQIEALENQVAFSAAIGIYWISYF